ncbi:glutamate 5-kinase [Ilyobacter sp.]|uniref:glutamate 5-kinase n=1 Tax=Ilyobacter sp. TaxID=3100343 RepID=UPI003568820B
MDRKEHMKKIKRIVVKVGTSTLTHANGLLNIGRIEKLVRTLSDLANLEYEIILVTSGAVGAGMGVLKLDEKPKALDEKQAVAAVGQVSLIHLYRKLFSEYGKNIAQILVNGEDISKRNRYINISNTFTALFDKKVIPIVNENDAVAVEEIKVGDNDTLSAYVASVVDADLLILLSDIEGLYTANPREDKNAKFISVVEEIDESIYSLASGVGGSKFGTGGMHTKIKAGEIATKLGVDMIIANGESPGIIREILNGEEKGTLFLGEKDISAKKHWIWYGGKVKGTIYVDNGAEKALCGKSSLLPVGVINVDGSFSEGDIIAIKNSEEELIAKGIANYSSVEIELLTGKQSDEIEDILGYKGYDSVVHINNLHLLKEV